MGGIWISRALFWSASDVRESCVTSGCGVHKYITITYTCMCMYSEVYLISIKLFVSVIFFSWFESGAGKSGVLGRVVLIQFWVVSSLISGSGGQLDKWKENSPLGAHLKLHCSCVVVNPGKCVGAGPL